MCRIKNWTTFLVFASTMPKKSKTIKDSASNCFIFSAPAIVILVIYFVYFPVDISSSAQFKFSQELLNSLQKSHQDVPNTILTKNHTKTEPIFNFDTNSEIVYSRFYITWPVLKPVFWSSQKSWTGETNCKRCRIFENFVDILKKKIDFFQNWRRIYEEKFEIFFNQNSKKSRYQI